MDLIDFHAHIIPRADHGSSSTDVSLAQLRYASKHGIDRVVATPHFYPQTENVESFLQRRNACVKRLYERIGSDLLPVIILGAEILICDNIEEMPLLNELCISDTNILLIELPFSDFSNSYICSVKELINKGYTVVLAHADRYNPRDIDKLITVGAYVQLNADSLCRFFIPKHIKAWISKECVFALGSDIHGPDNKAYKRFRRAIKKLGDTITPIKKHSDTIYNRNKG